MVRNGPGVLDIHDGRTDGCNAARCVGQRQNNTSRRTADCEGNVFALTEGKDVGDTLPGRQIEIDARSNLVVVVAGRNTGKEVIRNSEACRRRQKALHLRGDGREKI